ncbi:hypothetical protein OHT76_30395 [Streptomyces sp. NBC_00287]|uniref:hypothetical protein n=1 Tax=Streptomyces sp. NBC_00287 TaxID=2975702 RepID=UPI002E29DBC2|nr:hypothetical protein [Streptomyces sp. NBC_00287]
MSTRLEPFLEHEFRGPASPETVIDAVCDTLRGLNEAESSLYERLFVRQPARDRRRHGVAACGPLAPSPAGGHE